MGLSESLEPTGMIRNVVKLPHLRWLWVALVGLLWTTMGNATALAQRGDFGLSSFAAKSGVPQVLKNQAAGNAARDAVAGSRPGSLIERNFRVTGGLRRVGVLDGATAIESKVGRKSLTPAVRQELARDIKMMRSGQVDAVEWHFSPSGTTGLGGPTG